MSSPARSSDASRHRVPFLAALLALVAYLPTLALGFVWDDVQIIGREGWLEKFTLLDALRSNEWNTSGGHDHYRPFLFLSFRLDVFLWGHDPAGHHLTSALMHAVIVFLFAHLLLALGHGARATFLASLCFLLHPVHVESIAWVAGRTDPLVALFALPAALLLVKPRTRARDLAASCFFLGALFSKEVAVLLIPALVVVGWFRGEPTLRRVLLVFVPSLVLYLVLRIGVAGTTRSYPFALPRSLEEEALVLVTDVKLIGRYLTILVVGSDHGPIPYDEGVPTDVRNLTVVREALARSLDAEFFLALLALLGLVPALLVHGRRHPALAFAALLGLPGILLSMNLTTAAALFPFNDRFLFFATMIPACAVAILADRYENRPLPGHVSVPLALVAILWIHQCLVRVPRYLDLESFCEEAVRLNPASPISRVGLAHVRASQNRWSEAALQSEIAFALRPTAAGVDQTIQVQLQAKNYPRALELERRHSGALRSPRTLALLAEAALRLERTQEAKELATRAASTPEPSVEAQVALGLVMTRLGAIEEARRAYRKAIEIAPGSPIGYHNLRLLERTAGDPARVPPLLEEARRNGVTLPD